MATQQALSMRRSRCDALLGPNLATVRSQFGRLEEYEFALDLFKYEMANLLRDQVGAELGDEGRGLGSEDLPAMQKVRVPCLLNSAACHIKLGGHDHLCKALACCEEVLKAHPAAEKRAKAHFRSAQANHALGNHREAWASLQTAQSLNAGSREIRELQEAVSRELKALKTAERENREGMMATEMNHKQSKRRGARSYDQS